MLNANFVYLGAAIGLLGCLSYSRDTWRGVTHPNRVTWLLWGVIPMITYAAELNEHVGVRSLMTLAIGVGPFIVLASSFHNRTAVWQIGRLDYICAGLSVAGVVVWLVTRQGNVAIIASIAADALAGFPTVRKAWLAPETESAAAYLGGLTTATVTLLTVKMVTTGIVAFPIYIFFMSGLELILVRATVGNRWRAHRKVRAEVA